MGEKFEGFPKDMFKFLRELAANNERDWFNASKERYKQSVQAPMSAFISAMDDKLARISECFIADPRPHGGSMFRIYRDTHRLFIGLSFISLVPCLENTIAFQGPGHKTKSKIH